MWVSGVEDCASHDGYIESWSPLSLSPSPASLLPTHFHQLLLKTASEKLVERVPPFPDDQPTARMSVISLASLISSDKASAEAMLGACRGLGFFLLYLKDDALGGALTQEVDELSVS
jgi:hypothetical protein